MHKLTYLQKIEMLHRMQKMSEEYPALPENILRLIAKKITNTHSVQKAYISLQIYYSLTNDKPCIQDARYILRDVITRNLLAQVVQKIHLLWQNIEYWLMLHSVTFAQWNIKRAVKKEARGCILQNHRMRK